MPQPSNLANHEGLSWSHPLELRVDLVQFRYVTGGWSVKLMPRRAFVTHVNHCGIDRMPLGAKVTVPRYWEYD